MTELEKELTGIRNDLNSVIQRVDILDADIYNHGHIMYSEDRQLLHLFLTLLISQFGTELLNLLEMSIMLMRISCYQPI